MKQWYRYSSIVCCLILTFFLAGAVYYYYQLRYRCQECSETVTPNSAARELLRESQQIPENNRAQAIPTTIDQETTGLLNSRDTQKTEPIRTSKSGKKKNAQTNASPHSQTHSNAVMQNSAQHSDSTPQDDTHLKTRQATTRTITITNDITTKMLTYSHWTGRYKPTTFSISINGQVVPEGQEHAVSIHDNHLEIFYRYSFMNGYRTGARIISFTVNPDAQALSLTFSWKNKWHILLDHASPETAQEVSFKE